MSLFDPSKPSPPPAPVRRGERGFRAPVPEQPKEKRNRRSNKAVLKPRGFLLGDGKGIQDSRWYYDLDGRYVRVRGKKFLVELFGPRRALQALTESERAEVMNARQNARRNGRLDKGIADAD